jgi:effector-binding domain-containing protein
LGADTYKGASSKGFSILAGYIFGGNEKQEKIAMTAPVSMSLEDSITMMFMVPKSYKKDELPEPNQRQIEFVEMPAKRMAAIRFSGWANDEKIEKYKQKLIKALEKEGVNYTNKFYFFGYNAPFEVVNRRNEVVIELEG